MAKQDYTIICPACGREMPDSICHNCGYVRIVFPQVVPEAITRFDTERVSVLKNKIEREAKQQSEAARLQAKIDELNSDLAQAEESAKRAQAENSSLSSQVSNQRLQIRNLEIERNHSIAKGSDNVKKYQSEISDLQDRLSRKSAEAIKLIEELAATRTQLSKASSTPQNPLKGVVMIEDVRNDTRAMLPVYEGCNSYGSGPDNGLHHQIKFQVRGFSFRPVHFMVRTSVKGLIIEAAPGVEILQNGGAIRPSAYARQADNFMLENRIRINISPI